MKVRGRIPLQSLDAERIQQLREWQRWQTEAPIDLLLEQPNENWGELLELANDQQLQAVNEEFDEAVEAAGLQLTEESERAARAAVTQSLQKWGYQAAMAKVKGAAKAPKPRGVARTIGIDALCDLSVQKSWHGATTIPGVRNALKKSMTWQKKTTESSSWHHFFTSICISTRRSFTNTNRSQRERTWDISSPSMNAASSTSCFRSQVLVQESSDPSVNTGDSKQRPLTRTRACPSSSSKHWMRRWRKILKRISTGCSEARAHGSKKLWA